MASLLFQPNQPMMLVLVCAFGAFLGSLLGMILRRACRSPAERERQRRAMLHARGRMGDAIVTDIRGDLLIYTYSVRGVEYSASQDISALAGRLAEDRSGLIGHANLKYHPQNPANSIVVSEEWTGLRAAHGETAGAGRIADPGNRPAA